jgi:ribosomal-protein-alanine N-acetyltransferase
VLDLLFQSARIHTHLDWHEVAVWLDSQDVPIRLAWHENGHLAAMMAASEVMYGTCWLRLIAVTDSISAQSVMEPLWQELATDLREQGVDTAYVLILSDWLQPQIERILGFEPCEEIVTLKRNGPNLPPYNPNSMAPPVIRNAEREDMPAMIEVDHIAFQAPWQLTQSDLWQARRMSASCTVAIHDDEIVGYQLSTVFRQSAHLARLAVLPRVQGGGVGSALVDHMIRHFLRRGVRSITVNTQLSNHRSQRLYERYGFQRNGYDLAVWKARLQP